MRDALSTQRRRRLMMLQANSTQAEGIDSFDPSLSNQPIVGSSRANSEHSEIERLFRLCRGRADVVLRIESDEDSTALQIPLDRPFIVIGSDENCDVCLDHPDVAHRHAYFQWVAGHLVFVELTDERALSSQRPAAPPRMWIEHHPHQIGPFRLAVVGSEPLAMPAFSPYDRSPQLAAEFPQVRLKFEGVEQSDNQWPIDRPLTLIGRGSQCKLRLDHPEMPTVLASLIRTASGCWLIDLAGRGTTLVNGQPISLASLDIGDQLQLGPFHVSMTANAFSEVREPATVSKPAHSSRNLKEIAFRHRELIGELDEGLDELQTLMEIESLDDAPQLKMAIENHIALAKRNHQEMIGSLNELSPAVRQNS